MVMVAPLRKLSNELGVEPVGVTSYIDIDSGNALVSTSDTPGDESNKFGPSVHLAHQRRSTVALKVTHEQEICRVIGPASTGRHYSAKCRV